MSGILGLFHFNRQATSAASLAPALEIAAPYGPDGSGVWTDASAAVALGHRWQRLTPEPPEKAQPLARGALVIAADARIDARDELWARLGIPAAEQPLLTDAELILRAYEKWGSACPEHLVGDYAFALWDAREQRLFCARDHIGARPFYYYRTPALFAFASDLRALLALPGVETGIDEAEIARLLSCPTTGYFDNVHTFFRHVRKLPFGHRLTVGAGGGEPERYWHPEKIAPLRLPALADYEARLLALLRQAVADRLRTGRPVGAHLSGGLDSSAVAVLANRLLRERGDPPPVVFSWSPPPGAADADTEHARIEAVCRQEGLTPVYTEFPPGAEWDLKRENITLRSALTMNSERVVQREVARRGVRLMLSGWGGDEAVSFNGRGLLSGHLAGRRWRELAAFFNPAQNLRSPRRLVRMLRCFWSEALVPLLPEKPRRRFQTWCQNRVEGAPFLQPDFARRIAPALRPLDPRPLERPGVHATQFRLYHYGHLTARMESWAAFGADHQLVYAYPLTDRRLLEFIYAIPGDLHRSLRFGRHLARSALAPLLPPRMTWTQVKQDTRFLEILYEQQARHLRTAAENLNPARTHPWVDLPRLHKALTAPGKPSRIKSLYIKNALACLALPGSDIRPENNPKPSL